MRAALNEFFTQCHEEEEAKLPQKNLGIKKNDLLFLRFSSCGPFEKGPRGKSQMSPMPSSVIQLCWDRQVTFCR